MLLTISPSKGQDFDSDFNDTVISTPQLLDQSQLLIDELKKLTAIDIKKLMSVSDNIADLNFNRFKTFQTPFTLANAKPALFAFVGDVYSGFSKHEYGEPDLNYAQQHLRILSGLYGALRPMDLIQPYRLEMKTKLKNSKGANLYQFWGDKITEQLNQELAKHNNKILINLASNEYFKSIKPKKLNAKIITIHFREIKDDKCRVVAIFAKKARGLMSDYIIRNQIKNLEGIKAFQIANYKFDKNLSDDKNLVFTRNQP